MGDIPDDDEVFVPFEEAVRRVAACGYSLQEARNIIAEQVRLGRVGQIRARSGSLYWYDETPECVGHQKSIQSRRRAARDIGRYDPFTRSYPGAEELPP